MKAIGWYAPWGFALAKGYYWDKCPDCDKQCVYSPENKPTGFHKTNQKNCSESYSE